MCDKANVLLKEVKWTAFFRKDNQPVDEKGDMFEVLIRPCMCGKSVLGRVSDGTFYAEVEDVIL